MTGTEWECPECHHIYGPDRTACRYCEITNRNRPAEPAPDQNRAFARNEIDAYCRRTGTHLTADQRNRYTKSFNEYVDIVTHNETLQIVVDEIETQTEPTPTGHNVIAYEIVDMHDPDQWNDDDLDRIHFDMLPIVAEMCRHQLAKQ